MVIGLGTDIIRISRMRSALENKCFEKRVFADGELEYVKEHSRKLEVLSGSFASKEAFSKALGTGVRGFSFRDVEVFRDSAGAPRIILHGGAKTAADEKNVSGIHLSISHDGDYCVAVCILEG